MKKLLFLFLLMCFSSESFAFDLDGKYLSQSGELVFNFTNDSLYINVAKNDNKVSAFKLIKNKDSKKVTTFNAYETYLKDGREAYREVLIRVTRQKSNKYLLEYFGKDKDREYNSNERYTIRKIK